MTDTVAPRAKAPSDLQMLVQVEQWMATIREIRHEERAAFQSVSAQFEDLFVPSTNSF
ncbi:MAG TPA: hypothetical protein VHU22_12700 [Xanthobacteraceae bacterium]|jgi:hypothetical protein|nr:hypothetical protein [Xanthobacteraceae bacterium]